MEIQRNGEGVIIKNTAELSLEKLDELKKNGLVWVQLRDDRGTGEPNVFYCDTFEKIKNKVLEYASGAAKETADDPDMEKKKFTYVYEKIAKNVSYHEKASKACDLVGYERDMASPMIERASSLEAILEDKALCSGYSEILRNVLSEVGIDSLYISGGPKNMGEAISTNSGSHAWNQVKLDGKWYNCDLTNDADFILSGLKLPHFLKSNDEFTRYTKYPCKDSSKIQQANESVSEEKQEKLIEEQRQTLLEEEKSIENGSLKEQSIGKGFISKLKGFFKEKRVNAKELNDFSLDSINREERGR